MTLVYLLAAIAGWPFLLLFVFFGGDADADVSFDVDTDVEGFSTPEGGPFAAILSFFSLRSIVFFLAIFGLTGLLLNWLDVNGLITLAVAIALGFFAMWLNRTLIAYLMGSSSDSQVQDAEIAGTLATVVMPITANLKGRVAVEVAEQRIYLVASAFRPGADHEFENGDQVVVVEVVNGAALVAPFEM